VRGVGRLNLGGEVVRRQAQAGGEFSILGTRGWDGPGIEFP
jgi:hypothetical protein